MAAHKVISLAHTLTREIKELLAQSNRSFLHLCHMFATKSRAEIPEGLIKQLSDHYMMHQPWEIRDQYTEMLSIFDRNGIYCGEANWYFAHIFGYIIGGDAVMVYNKDNDRFLVQTRGKNMSWPGFYDASTGGCLRAPIRTAPDIQAHAELEFAEELFSARTLPAHVELSATKTLFFEQKGSPFTKRQFLFVFTAVVDNSFMTRLIPDLHEIGSLTWMHWEDILALPKDKLAPGLKTIITQG